MNVLKRFVSFACVVIGFFITTRAQATDYNLPSDAKVTLQRDSFRLDFRWWNPEAKPPLSPNFPAGTAVEFQVSINPKCFAEPIGGRDDNKQKPNDENLPSAADPYTDVWNYWVPPTNKLGGILEERCGKLSIFKQFAAEFYDWKVGIVDKGVANFAVGVHDASVLQANKEYYYFVYPLQVPMRKECVDAASDSDPTNDPDVAYVKISMQHFVSPCVMENWFGLGDDSVYTCPELLGFPGWKGKGGCNGPDAATQFWLKRLCAPTDEWPFTPGENVTFNGEICIDKDGDHYFDVQLSPMFGSNVGDCNDDPDKNGASIHPTHLEVCNDDQDNDCNMQTDCNDSTCSATPVCLSPSTCPTGNGYYCGDASLGQDTDSVYSCVDGMYSFAKSCNGLGCMKNGPMMDDACNQGADPCAGVTCTSPPNPQCQNSSGTCVGGFCEYGFKPQGYVCNDGNACTSNDTCDAFGNCFGSGNCEVCDGIDNDGNGLIDDGISGCWTSIYRYKDPVTGARCLNNTNAGPPSACSSYGYEKEAFIVRATQMPNTFQGIQCSHLTDHIVVPFGSTDHNALISAGYDCSLSLGYFYYPGTGPDPGTTEWSKTCPMYRFSDPLQILDDGHIFTIYDNTAGITCEGYKADVLTNQFCFASPPQGC